MRLFKIDAFTIKVNVWSSEHTFHDNDPMSSKRKGGGPPWGNNQLHIIDEKCHVSRSYVGLILGCLIDDIGFNKSDKFRLVYCLELTSAWRRTWINSVHALRKKPGG